MGIKLNQKVKDVISVVAPVLGGALGGPLGGLAGHVLSNVLGGGDQEALEDAILNQNPETLLLVKKAEIEFKQKLREMEVREEEIYAADSADARDLAKTNMRPHMILSTVFITGYFVTLGMFFLGEVTVPDRLKDAFLLLLGVITATVPTIMAFWFGSTAGSARKTDMLARVK